MHRYANGTCQRRRCRCQKACRTLQSEPNWLAAQGTGGSICSRKRQLRSLLTPTCIDPLTPTCIDPPGLRSCVTLVSIKNERHVCLYLCTFYLTPTGCGRASRSTTTCSLQRRFYLTIIEKCKDSGQTSIFAHFVMVTPPSDRREHRHRCRRGVPAQSSPGGDDNGGVGAPGGPRRR